MASNAFPILYCGDTSLGAAAGYLAGLLTHRGEAFDYVPGDRPLSNELVEANHPLLILSDYPAARIPLDLQEQLVAHIAAGAGLLMIGGWESFQGAGGGWRDTPLGNILPVEIAETDDRLNFDQPAAVRKVADHPIVDGLPWEDRPPSIGGVNRFTPKPRSTTLLEVDSFALARMAGQWRFDVAATHPLLVIGQHGRGCTAAIATDVAPHWVGGFVDWGPGRVSAQAPGADPIEVGNLYARFWRQLLTWVHG